MSRVEINAGGRQIIIDHSGELEPIRAAALALWRDTDSPEPSPGPAVGFSADRRWTPEVPPLGHSAYDRGRQPAPVTAEQTPHGPNG